MLAGAAAWWFDRRADDADPSQEFEVVPAGRWHRVTPVAADDPEELARVLSLPYTAGSRPATDQVGVVAHDEALAQPGVNLYVSGHDPEAILMTNGGRALHRWFYPFERAFPDRPTTTETGFFRRAHLFPDGDLLVLYQGGGLVRLSPRSEPRWAIGRGFYNDFHVGPDGTIHAIGKLARRIDEIDPEEAVLEDFVQVMEPDGELVSRASLLELMRASPFAELLEPLPQHADILHSNTITVLDGALAERSPLFAAGNWLVSLREVDVVAIVNPRAPAVLWARRGPWVAQHEPVLLEDGRILLFDNRGADGRTRILEIDPLAAETDSIRWEYRGPEARPLLSEEGGSVARLANGNTLITESEAGRAIEIDRRERIVWEFVSPHRAGSNDELVATLWEVQRLPRGAAAFLRGPVDR